MTDTATSQRDELAQQTAEYIANVLIPEREEFYRVTDADALAGRGPRITRIGTPGPTDVADIKQVLLDGRLWISWMDDRVCAAMDELHGPPTGDVTHFTGGDV